MRPTGARLTGGRTGTPLCGERAAISLSICSICRSPKQCVSRPRHPRRFWASTTGSGTSRPAIGWVGPFDDASPFYYRILSPVILVEFDHQSGIIYNNDTPSRDHIHTVVRTPNGWRCWGQSEHGIARPRTVAVLGGFRQCRPESQKNRRPGQVGVCYPLDC